MLRLKKMWTSHSQVKPMPPVELDRAVGDEGRGVRRCALGHARRLLGVLGAAIDLTGCVVDQRPGAIDFGLAQL